MRLRSRPKSQWILALTLALGALGERALANPVPRGTTSAAESMMKSAAKQADAGHADKALEQAKKAIDLVTKAGGPDAPELIRLRAEQAHIATLAGDAATAREAVLDGARIAEASPPGADGVKELEGELDAMTAQPDTTPEGRALIHAYVASLERESAPHAELAEAYRRLASSTPVTQTAELVQALDKRIAIIAADGGPASHDAVNARLEAAASLASQATANAKSDHTTASKLLDAAEKMLAPIDPSTVDPASRAQFVSATRSLASSFTATRAEVPDLSKDDADHAIALLERAVAGLGPEAPATLGDRASLSMDEALLLAASDRGGDARDRFDKALSLYANAPADLNLVGAPGTFAGLLAFLDTPTAGATASTTCRAPKAVAASVRPIGPFGVAPVCAGATMIDPLATAGAAAAKRLKDTASEGRFHVRVASAACADGDGQRAHAELDAVLEATRADADPAALARREYEDAALLVECDVGGAEARIADAIGMTTDPADDTDARAFAAFADGTWRRTGEAHRVERVANLMLEHADKVDSSGNKRGRVSLVAGEKLVLVERPGAAKPMLDAALAALTKDAPAGPPDPPRAASLFRVHTASARGAVLAGDMNTAATELEAALDASDQSGAAPGEVAKLLVELARIDRDRHDATGLGKVSTRALALPALSGAGAEKVAEIGRILAEGDPASARSFYEARKGRSNDEAGQIVDLARVYGIQGDHATARSMLENAYSQDTKNPEIDCALMAELAATGEPDASNMLRDKLVREIDPTSPGAPRALGCLIDGLAHGGHISDADDVVRRVFDAEAKDATAANKEPLLVPFEAAWAYRVAGDGERAAKWGAIYQRSLDKIAFENAPSDIDRDVARAFAVDHGLPSLLDIEAAAKPTSKPAIEAALETALRWQGREADDDDGGAGIAKDVTVAALRDKLPSDGAFVAIVRVAPISADPARAASEAFDAIGPAADVKRDPARYIAYVLPKRGDVRTFEVGAAHDVDDQVMRYIDAVAHVGGDTKKPAGDLAKEIVEPLLDDAPAAHQIVIAADGELALLPIGALPTSGGTPLLFRKSVSFVASGRALLTGAAARETGPTVVLAAPEVSKAETKPKGKSAPGGHLEADAWKRAFPDAKESFGADASEATLKAVRAPRTMLLSASGFAVTLPMPTGSSPVFAHFQPLGGAESPPSDLLAGVLLAGAGGAGKDGDDGVFTAREASRLDLRGTKLVVLTPFNLGVGLAQAGEGLGAVRRALTLAGADTVVTSLWQSDDTVTAALLTDFAKHLSRGLGRAEALRLAQATIAADPRTHDAYYWAGFTVYGSTAAIAGGAGKSAQPDIDALHVKWGGCGCFMAPLEGDGVAWPAVGVTLALAFARARRGRRERSRSAFALPPSAQPCDGTPRWT